MYTVLILLALITICGAAIYHKGKLKQAKMFLSYHLEEEAYIARRKRTDEGIIVFHGACLGCKTQLTLGVEQCKSCKYFNVSRNFPGETNNLPDLRT